MPPLNTLASSWWGKARIGLQYLLSRSGPMSMAPSQLGAFTRSDPSQPHPNIEYHVQPLSLDAFAQAAQQAGIAATSDFNRGCNEGVGYFEVNQKSGWRWNTAKAFVRPTCYGRANFAMWTSAQATRLLTERQADGQRRCTGVQVWTGQALVTVRATREVLLCAGAVNSPQLLQL